MYIDGQESTYSTLNNNAMYNLTIYVYFYRNLVKQSVKSSFRMYDDNQTYVLDFTVPGEVYELSFNKR